MHVRALEPFGASVARLDLAEPTGGEAASELGRLAHRHGVLVFRDQRLDPSQQIAFSRGLGELEIHPEKLKRQARHPEVFDLSNVDEDGRVGADRGAGTERWHTDSSYREIPCTLSILYAVEIPPDGGDTEFANACLAYECLSRARRSRLETLRAVHSYQHSSPDAWATMSDDERAAVPPVEHPLVRTLGDGRRALYIGSHASHLAGWGVEEGRALLAELLLHATAPQRVHRHRWRVGDVVIWDNRVTLHRRLPYRAGRDRRVMRRTTVRGRERVV